MKPGGVNPGFLGANHQDDASIRVYSMSTADRSLVPSTAHRGPSVVRRASHFISESVNYEPTTSHIPSLLPAQQLSLSDDGDVEFPESREEVELLQRKIFSGLQSLAILLAGDDSCNFPCLVGRKGLVIHLDAHDDRNINARGLSHANFIARLMQTSPDLQFIQMGVRGFFSQSRVPPEDPRVINLGDLDDLKLTLPKFNYFEEIYVILDIDILDPSVFPQVACPQPLGWTYQDLERVLGFVAQDPRMRFISVSEFAPRGPEKEQLLAGLTIAEILVGVCLTHLRGVDHRS